MKKRRIIILFSILTPLIIAVGISTWVILNNSVFAPSYNPDSKSLVMEAFDEILNEDGSSNNIYNAEVQYPISRNDTITNENVEMYYREFDTKNTYKKIEGNNGPVDAGTYEILIKPFDSNYKNDVVKFTIDKATPKLKEGVSVSLSGKYEDDEIQITNEDDLRSSILGVNNTVIIPKDFSVQTDSIDFGESTTETKEVSVKVIYDFYSNLDAKNYKIVPFDAKITLSAVAYIAGNNKRYFGSIPSALNAADGSKNEIVILIPPSDGNYPTTTAPTKLVYSIKKDCEIKEGVSLVIPTDAANISSVTNISTLSTYITSMQKDDGSRGTNLQYATTNENRYLRVTLNIQDNITLTNNGDLIVSGYLSGGNSGSGMVGQTAFSYSRIILGNNSNITQVSSSSSLHCYGYISEKSNNNSSKINISNGKLYVPFIVNDYKGFQCSWAMTDGAIDNEGCSPFNQFEIRNIDVYSIIAYDTKVYGIANFYVKYNASIINVDEHFDKTLNIIGNTNDFLIQFNNSTYSSLEYKFDKTVNTATIKIYGGMILNNLELKLQKSIVTVDLSTKTAFFPISYRQKIELLTNNNQDQAIFDMKNQKTKLLPGSHLKIGENCIINASDFIVYSAFCDGNTYNGFDSYGNYGAGSPYPLKNGAILINYGKINCTSFGGLIYKGNNSSSITTINNDIISKEPWSVKGSGKSNPAWTITEYLEIKEQLLITSIDNLNKEKLYVAINTFKNYDTFLPAANIIYNENRISVDTYQKVIFVENISTFSVELVKNIFKVIHNTSNYQKNNNVAYSSSAPYLCLINSMVEISNNNNGINEFEVQSVEVQNITPLIDGKIPLYIDTTISLEANVVDIDKVYNKTITWESSDNTTAVVDPIGIVTGKKLGKVTIYAICDGVYGEIELEVIEKNNIIGVTSVTISDDKGGSSENTKEITISNTKYNYNSGTHKKNVDLTITANILPSNAPVEITWTYKDTMVNTAKTFYKDGDQNKTKVFEITGDKIVHLLLDGNAGASPDLVTVILNVKGYDVEGNQKEWEITYIICQDGDGCIVENTLITMANGSQKKVEDLKIGDEVLVLNHKTGKLDISIVAVNVHESQSSVKATVINLIFDNGQNTRISFEHGFFDVILNQYVYINEENYQSMIGHHFYTMDGSSITLVDAYLTEEEVKVFSPVTYKHLNIFADNLLSIGGDLRGLFNIFEFNENMQIDIEKMNNDIEKYGLYEYDEWSEYLTYEQFIAFNVKYLKVSIGKGLVTKEEIIRYIKSYL